MTITIKDASLNDINLAKTFELSQTTFKNCKMQGAIFPAALADMQGMKMYDCTISDKQFENIAKIPYGVNHRIHCDFDRRVIQHETYCADTNRVLVSYEPVVYLNSFEVLQRIYPKTDIIGYKILWNKMYRQYVMCKLRIRSDVPSVIFPGDKCRAAFAEVIAIYDKFGNVFNEGCSCYASDFITYSSEHMEYAVGHTIFSDFFDPDDPKPCTHGIHFFLTEYEAWKYAIGII